MVSSALLQILSQGTPVVDPQGSYRAGQDQKREALLKQQELQRQQALQTALASGDQNQIDAAIAQTSTTDPQKAAVIQQLTQNASEQQVKNAAIAWAAAASLPEEKAKKVLAKEAKMLPEGSAVRTMFDTALTKTGRDLTQGLLDGVTMFQKTDMLPAKETTADQQRIMAQRDRASDISQQQADTSRFSAETGRQSMNLQDLRSRQQLALQQKQQALQEQRNQQQYQSTPMHKIQDGRVVSVVARNDQERQRYEQAGFTVGESSTTPAGYFKAQEDRRQFDEQQKQALSTDQQGISGEDFKLKLEELEDLGGATMPVRTFANWIAGPVFGEIAKDTALAKRKTQLFNQKLRGLLKVSTYGSTFDMKQLNKMLPDPDTFWQSPQANIDKALQLRSMTETMLNEKQNLLAREPNKVARNALAKDINNLKSALRIMPQDNMFQDMSIDKIRSMDMSNLSDAQADQLIEYLKSQQK